ncbi:hypothetical protein O6H91_04G056500 [Diphasiastrum complanatum]|uniref:Uncharacterized protein n=1 Tax=Diphasiastrum complanatum TaxID=34168 RepID=A0ACC2DX89_DIPCM|nr:hypothetical protein O6H91_04G056500 [Diphasiastrum complanatum]
MSRKTGDWNCASCQHLNFSRRDSCQRCGEFRSEGGRSDEAGGGDEYGSFRRGSGSSQGFGPRYNGGGGGGSAKSYGGSFGFSGGSDAGLRPGDWYCSANNCNAHNFASRSSCFKCGASKDERADNRGQDYDRSGEVSRSYRDSYGFAASYNTGRGSSRSGWKPGDWICGRSHQVM